MEKYTFTEEQLNFLWHIHALTIRGDTILALVSNLKNIIEGFVKELEDSSEARALIEGFSALGFNLLEDHKKGEKEIKKVLKENRILMDDVMKKVFGMIFENLQTVH